MPDQFRPDSEPTSTGERIAALAERVHALAGKMQDQAGAVRELSNTVKDVSREHNLAIAAQAERFLSALKEQGDRHQHALSQQGERNAHALKEQADTHRSEMSAIRVLIKEIQESYVKKDAISSTWKVVQAIVQIIGWVGPPTFAVLWFMMHERGGVR